MRLVTSKVLSLALLLSGCATVSGRLSLAPEDLESVTTAASKVREKPSAPAEASGVAKINDSSSIDNADIQTKLDIVHELYQDSRIKCDKFQASLQGTTAGSNVFLDLMSTVSSALATVFTPLTVTHSLSASSTIFGAAKTSISTEYLNTLSITHISQSISATYGEDMKKYLAYLDNIENAVNPSLNVYAERSRILSYHSECSLISAESSIANTLQGPASPQNPSPKSGQANPSATYKVNSAVSIKDAAKPLIDAIMSSSLKSAGVVALPPTPPADGVVWLRMEKAFKLTLSVTPPSESGDVSLNNDSSPVTLTVIKPLPVGTVITISGTPPPPSTPSQGSQTWVSPVEPVPQPAGAVGTEPTPQPPGAGVAGRRIGY